MADDTAHTSSGRSPVARPLEHQSHAPRWPAGVAAFLVFAFALYQALGTNNVPDFFIYRLGAELAASGVNPYDIETIRQHVATQYPDPDPTPESLVKNCGYFLPPMAALLYMPFALLPWVPAKVAWAVVTGLAAYAIARVAGGTVLIRAPQMTSPIANLVPFALVLNPLTLAVVVVGQVTVVSVGCVAAGLWAFARAKPYLAAVLWVVPFVKPHLALPLIPLAWFLGGWRPAALLVVLVAGLNVIGAWVIGGSPAFLRDYIAFLPTTRDAVLYNRVELNPTIASWNRLLFVAGGPLVELTALTTLAGYCVWFGLLGGRVSLAGERPSIAWAVAAVAVGAVLCSQVLAYELVILVLVVPWVRELFTAGWRLRGWLAIGLLVMQVISRAVMEQVGLEAHHPLGVAGLALLVLLGPIAVPAEPKQA